MRVVLITEYLPESTDVEVTGGVEACVHYVTSHLADRIQMDVLARRTDGRVWDDASVRSLPGRVAFLAKALVRAVRDPGDVFVSTTYVVHPVGWLAAKLRRRPIIFWYHDVLIGTWLNGQFGTIAGLLGEVTERVLLRLPVDHYIANSAATAGKLEVHGIRPERVSVVPNGFEPSVVDPLRAYSSTDDCSIIFVGRLVPYKRVDLVVRSIAALRERHPRIRLVVVGQGPERSRLQLLARELGVADAVEFRGFVPGHAEVLSIVARSALFVSASEIEGFGIALIEAMALGKPYVVSAIPAFEEVTRGGVGGSLFQVGDERSLVESISRLLADEGLRRQLGVEGAAHARQYTWQRVAERTAEVLNDTMERSKRRRGRKATPT